MTHASHPEDQNGHAGALSHAEEAAHVRPQAITFTVRMIGIVEEVILAFIAIVLIVLAVLLLLDSGSQLFEVVKDKGLVGLNPQSAISAPNASATPTSVPNPSTAAVAGIVSTLSVSATPTGADQSSGTNPSNAAHPPTESGASALTILESVLLVAVIMEIVYTVTLSLRSHELSAEPFLVIGIIAAIRRILEITIKSSGLESSDPDAFKSLLAELGLLSVIVISLAIAMFLVRRSRKFLPESSQT